MGLLMATDRPPEKLCSRCGHPESHHGKVGGEFFPYTVPGPMCLTHVTSSMTTTVLQLKPKEERIKSMALSILALTLPHPQLNQRAFRLIKLRATRPQAIKKLRERLPGDLLRCKTENELLAVLHAAVLATSTSPITEANIRNKVFERDELPSLFLACGCRKFIPMKSSK